MISRRAQPWLGTLVEITAEGDDMPCLLAAMDRAFARIATIHASMSFQAMDSELTRINQSAQHDWTALSPDLAIVFTAALNFARTSAGLFDPSVAGWLVESGHLPRHPEFPETAAPDWRAIELDGDRVRYARPLLVDLSGIAKGYAVDAALAVLRESGMAAATVNAGGDLARFGDTATAVHVRHPHRPTHTLRLAELRKGAVATSASYFQPNALRHPASGRPLCVGSSVTVLAADCTTADAFTKIVAAGLHSVDGRRKSIVVDMLAHCDAQAIVLDDSRVLRCDANGWSALPLEMAA